jgi:hypothetical protein
VNDPLWRGETVFCRRIPDFTYENHMNTTGRCPVEFDAGTLYVLVMFAGIIHMEPLDNKSSCFLTEALERG